MNAKAPPKADAAVVCLYGGMGQGKSVENIYSWAARGLFLAQPGALRGGITVVGYDVSSQTQACSRLEDVPYWIEYAKEHGFEAVVIDDASLMMHNTQNLSRSMFETPGKPGTYDFGMYTYWENQVTNVAS